MRPFPGKIEKKKTSKTHPYTLTDEQKVWMIETFPVTENRKMMAAMEVSYPTLHKLAHQLGLCKDKEWMKAIRQEKCEEHKRKNRHYKLLLMSGQRITSCTNLRLRPYTRRQIDIRRSALDRGYLLASDISEGSDGRYAIYYNEETARSQRFEATCQRHGLRVIKE